MPILEKSSPLDEQLPLFEDPAFIYWETQKLWKHRATRFGREVQKYWLNLNAGRIPPPAPKFYAEAPVFKLALRPELLEISYFDLLRRRRTNRGPTATKRRLSFPEFSTWIACGGGAQQLFAPHETPRGTPYSPRCTAGPGGIYPTELYFLNLGVETLPLGIYHFHPIHGVLRQIREGLTYQEAASVLPQPKASILTRNAAGVLIATSMFDRLRQKYGTRFVRFAAIDAGTTYQALDYAACALDLVFYPQGSLYENETCELLGIDGTTEGIMWGGVLGCSPASE